MNKKCLVCGISTNFRLNNEPICAWCKEWQVLYRRTMNFDYRLKQCLNTFHYYQIGELRKWRKRNDYSELCYERDSGMFDEGCYEGNIDTAQHLYDRFGVCMTRIKRTDSTRRDWVLAAINADVVVVKGGNGYRLYNNVKKWEIIKTHCCNPKPNISHISYFVCDENAICN